MKLVSACLVGINCKWNGKSHSIKKIIEEFEKGDIIPLCPEILGGLSIPRSPCGIFNGTGADVINGTHRVISTKGEDFTKNFIEGSGIFLEIAKKIGVKQVILKKTSPCCGVDKTWQMRYENGKYKNHLVDGDGVLTALLKRNEIKVIIEGMFR